MNHTNNENKNNKITPKRIAAILCIVLLVSLYLVTLIFAITDNSASHVLFRAALYGTVVIPLITWVYIFLYGKITGKDTIADVHLENMRLPEEETGEEITQEDTSESDS